MKRPALRVGVAAVALLATVGLGGCSVLSNFLPSSQPVRDAESGKITEQVDNADVFSLRVGDCLNSAALTAEELTSIPVVPCDLAHDDEVFHSLTLDEAAYPGDDEIARIADVACRSPFREFVGVSFDQSALDFWPMTPTSSSWANGDREVLCIAFDPAGKVTGSLAGAAR